MARCSGWLASQTGRSDLMTGIDTKLWGGGGELVAHSSVWPSHGLAAAGTGRRQET